MQKLRKVAKGANDKTLSMQISNYFNEEEKKADRGRKWHNDAENFIISTYHKKTCTENREEDR